MCACTGRGYTAARSTRDGCGTISIVSIGGMRSKRAVALTAGGAPRLCTAGSRAARMAAGGGCGDGVAHRAFDGGGTIPVIGCRGVLYLGVGLRAARSLAHVPMPRCILLPCTCKIMTWGRYRLAAKLTRVILGTAFQPDVRGANV